MVLQALPWLSVHDLVHEAAGPSSAATIIADVRVAKGRAVN